MLSENVTLEGPNLRISGKWIAYVKEHGNGEVTVTAGVEFGGHSITMHGKISACVALIERLEREEML